MKKKILIVCQHYYPENFQVTDICEELVKRGYEVTALVGLPNYPEGYVLDNYKHHKNRDEYINGVHVLRCFEIGRRKGKLFLALNYLSFWFSSLLKVNSLSDDFDMVLGYETSPITMVAAAKKYAKKYNKPFILWCCDIWPECLKVYIKSESNSIFKIFKKISKDIYSSANLILCQSKSFIDYLKSTHNISKTEYLPYFFDDSKLTKEHIDNNVIDFVFLGNIGRAQNLEGVVDAFEKVCDLDFMFHIVGDGSDLNDLIEYTNSRNISNKVKFYGRKPAKEMNDYYKLADACIVSLNSENEIGYTLPTKVQGYMAAKKAIIGMISGSAKAAIEEANCGLCVEGNDVNGLSNCLKDFIINNEKYKDCGNNAYDYYMKNFKKDSVMSKLTDIIDMYIREY